MPKKGEGYRQKSGALPFKNHGNGQKYLLARICRDHPDIFEAFERGEFGSSTYKAARAAGIIRDPNTQDAVLDRRLRLWQKADDETRAFFDALRDDVGEEPVRGPQPNPT